MQAAFPGPQHGSVTIGGIIRAETNMIFLFSRNCEISRIYYPNILRKCENESFRFNPRQYPYLWCTVLLILDISNLHIQYLEHNLLIYSMAWVYVLAGIYM
jgi:hypothetical protein